jgi:hypothetical protein
MAPGMQRANRRREVGTRTGNHPHGLIEQRVELREQRVSQPAGHSASLSARPDAVARMSAVGAVGGARWLARIASRTPGSPAPPPVGAPRSAGSSRARGLLSLVGVGDEPVGQLARTAEADVVAAVHLVGVDAEAVAYAAACPYRREHAIVAAQEVSRRGVRPGFEGPRLPQRLRLLVPFAPLRLGRERWRDVVVEDVLVAALLVAGVRSPVREELAGRGDHRRHEDEQLGGDARTYERRREAAERVPHDDEAAVTASRRQARVRRRRAPVPLSLRRHPRRPRCRASRP